MARLYLSCLSEVALVYVVELSRVKSAALHEAFDCRSKIANPLFAPSYFICLNELFESWFETSDFFGGHCVFPFGCLVIYVVIIAKSLRFVNSFNIIFTICV